MSSYTVLLGDTFESIAKKVYGTELKASLIITSNPGVFEPLSIGNVITVPPDPLAPTDKDQDVPSDNENQVTLKINKQRFTFWRDILITRSLDSMDTIQFTAPFDPNDKALRKTFVPFSYADLGVFVGDSALFTGTMLSPTPSIIKDSRNIVVTGYSLPGVLNDCNPPASAYPLENDGLDIKQTAEKLASPFGIAVVFEAGVIEETQTNSEQTLAQDLKDLLGGKFQREANNPDQKVLQFLAQLAKERNLIISSTPKGELLFTRSVEVGTPVATLREGESPLRSINAQFNPQAYHSSITGLEPVLLGLKGSQYTAKNQFLTDKVRPFTFYTEDSETGEVQKAVNSNLGRMFGNMASYTIEVASWRTPAGELWKPNTTVLVNAPGAMIYNDFEFVIRSVEYSRTDNSETANLTLVLPGSFSGKAPDSLPWLE